MTTYLITKSQSNQSLDIVFAMSYGCFIVSEDWVRNYKFFLNFYTFVQNFFINKTYLLFHYSGIRITQNWKMVISSTLFNFRIVGTC